MDDVKEVVAEWVLTNGKLPGFEERVVKTLPKWSIVGKDGMVVYRGQGGVYTQKVGSLPPTEMESGIRSVISASKTPESVLRFTGRDCCVYKITVAPGIRYIDVNSLLTFVEPIGLGKKVLGVKNTVLQNIIDRCPDVASKGWPIKTTEASSVRNVILERCIGRHRLNSDGKNTLVTPPENEILLDGTQGMFLNKKPICPMAIEDTVTYSIDYLPRVAEDKPIGAGAGGVGGRRSTRRRKRKTRKQGKIRLS